MLPIEFRPTGDPKLDWSLAASKHAGVRFDRELEAILTNWDREGDGEFDEGKDEFVGQIEAVMIAAGYTLGAVREQGLIGPTYRDLHTRVVDRVFGEDYAEWTDLYLSQQRLIQSGDDQLNGSADSLRALVDGEYSRKIRLMNVMMRGMASYAMWRAIETAGHIPDGEKPKRHVAAVGLDIFVNEIALAYRGEAWNDRVNGSMHAEHLLLEKIEALGKMQDLFLVGVNLTPCRERSDKHREYLGEDLRGCSERLVDAGVRVVAYSTPDNGASGRGAGTEILVNGGVVVFEADHAFAIASGMLANAHFNDMAEALNGLNY